MSNPNPEIPDGQIQQAINDVNKEKAGFPLEVAIPGTPQVFKGQTPQEVLDQLVNAQTHASKLIGEQKTELETLKRERDELRAQAPQPTAGDAAQQAKIADRYATWAKNPTEATKQDFEELLGVPIEVVRRAMQAQVANTASAEFLQRYPQFPNNNEAAALMSAEVERRYGKNIAAASADNLELAYNALVREGKLQPQQLPISRTIGDNTPIPQFKGTGGPPNPEMDLRAQAYTMPLADLKKVLERVTK